MLNITSITELASFLETSTTQLIKVAENAPRHYDECLLIDPEKPNKTRDIHRVKGALRQYQLLMYRKLLKPRHHPSDYTHGGISGRNVKTNAIPHLDSSFVFTTDVANFFPTISHQRVYSLFAEEFGCSQPVARICTKLCTHLGHLALGLITSPVLADRMMVKVDRRIGVMCEKQGLVYSRFVDDITISGTYPIDSGSYTKIVVQILQDNGFKVNPEKHAVGHGKFCDGKHITKLRIKRGRLDVREEYLGYVMRQIEDMARLERGGDPVGLYFSPAQILGRIHFIWWINPGRTPALLGRFRSIDRGKVEAEALTRKLVPTKKRVIKKPIFEPEVGTSELSPDA